MVSRDEGIFVLYPIYFDREATRDEGRRVPKNLAVENPKVESIAKAAKSLDLKPKIEKEAAHPVRHWKNEGRVIVEQKGTKQEIVKNVAKKL